MEIHWVTLTRESAHLALSQVTYFVLSMCTRHRAASATVHDLVPVLQSVTVSMRRVQRRWQVRAAAKLTARIRPSR